MKKIFLIFIVLFPFLWAENVKLEFLYDQKQYDQLLQKLSNVEEKINSSDNVWLLRYRDYIKALTLEKKLSQVEKKIDETSRHLVYLEKKSTTIQNDKNPNSSSEKLRKFQRERAALVSQLNLLNFDIKSPFATFMKPHELNENIEVSNPLRIFSAFSQLKQQKEQKAELENTLKQLDEAVHLIKQKSVYTLALADLTAQEKYEKLNYDTVLEYEDLQSSKDILKNTFKLYAVRIQSIEQDTRKKINKQLYALAQNGIIILVFIVLSILIKRILKRYIHDNERYYMSVKVINILNIMIIVAFLMFSYIENVDYLVTLLGFASAGIAIAMKEWFMSILGWFTIVLGGTIKVGDRIKVFHYNAHYIGDVIGISLLRITLHEAVESMNIFSNFREKRAGRVIVIPNNYVFTHVLQNYTHNRSKTVWDVIEIDITFDSNHQKARKLAREIAKKRSQGYMDQNRKQLDKLSERYSIRKYSPEPKVHSFIEGNGIRVIIFYLTNAYLPMLLRTQISMDIIDAYKKEKDILIAFRTQRIYANTTDETRINEFDNRE